MGTSSGTGRSGDENLIVVFTKSRRYGRCKDCGDRMLWLQTHPAKKWLPFVFLAFPRRVERDETGEPIEYLRREDLHRRSCRVATAQARTSGKGDRG